MYRHISKDVLFTRVSLKDAEDYIKSVFCLDDVNAEFVINPMDLRPMCRIRAAVGRSQRYVAFNLDSHSTWGDFQKMVELCIYRVQEDLDKGVVNDKGTKETVGGKAQYSDEDLRSVLSSL